MKKEISIHQFKEHIHDGMTIMVGGFMAVGTPEPLIDAILESGIKELTIICNDAGFLDKGVGKLIQNRQVRRLIASHIGLNPIAGQLMSEQAMEVELVPQGTLIERIRSHGAGLGGVLTKTGLGTLVEENKAKVTVDGVEYLLEKPLKADLSILRGSKVDPFGNVYYHETTRNFNPIMATAADKVIVYAVERVETLDPNLIMTPHLFIDYVVRGDILE